MNGVNGTRSGRDSDDDSSMFGCFDLRLRTNSFDLPPMAPPASASAARHSRIVLLSRMFRSWSDSSVKSAVDPAVLITSATSTSSSSSQSSVSSTTAAAALAAATISAVAATGLPASPAQTNRASVTVHSSRIRSSPTSSSSSPIPNHRRTVRLEPESSASTEDPKAFHQSNYAVHHSPSSTARPLRPRVQSPPPVEVVVSCSGVNGVNEEIGRKWNRMPSYERHHQRLYGCSSGDDSDSTCQLYDVDWVAVGARGRLLPLAPPPSPASSFTASSSSRVQQLKHASFFDEVQVIEFDKRDKVRHVRSAGTCDNRHSRTPGSGSSLKPARRQRRVRTEPLRMAESLK